MKSSAGVAALLAALIVAGCGGEEMTTGAPTTPPEPPPAPGEEEGGRVIVDIQGLEFVPEDVNVPAGATVIFTNSDDVSHTVTKREGPGPDFDSGPIPPGGTFSQVFPDPGVVEILDKNRPETELTITVEELEGTDGEDRDGGGDGDGGGGDDNPGADASGAAGDDNPSADDQRGDDSN